MLILALLGLFQVVSCYKIDLEKLEGLARGRVETCGGWQLSVLTEVKAFVQKDLPLYHNLVLKYIPGASPELILMNLNFEELDIHNLVLNYFPGVDPELILMNYAYQELDRVNLMPITRKDINELLQKLGFYKKETLNAEVPMKFYFAPMVGRPIRQFDSLVGETLQEDESEESEESDELNEDL